MKTTLQSDPQIFARYAGLKAQSKADLIRRFPSRLDNSHLRTESKATIINAYLNAEFSRARLDAWNGKN